MKRICWPNVTVIAHPVVQEQLTIARDKTTGVQAFRRLLKQITRFMAFEVFRDYPTEPLDVETPMATHRGVRLARGLTLVPILRAGLGMTDGVLELFPSARVGYLGIYRNQDTLQPVTYYNKLPPNIADTEVLVIDPMLATAGSLVAALDVLKETGAKHIKVLCLVAAPEGLAAFTARHPEVPVFTAAIDSHLDHRGYIVPGLGDAGDRIFGTR